MQLSTLGIMAAGDHAPAEEAGGLVDVRRVDKAVRVGGVEHYAGYVSHGDEALRAHRAGDLRGHRVGVDVVDVPGLVAAPRS